jgi:hypothetical protein
VSLKSGLARLFSEQCRAVTGSEKVPARPGKAVHLAGQSFPEFQIRMPAATTTAWMQATFMAEKQLPEVAGHMLTGKEQGQVRTLRTTNS